MEALAIRLEAMAIRLEAIASRFLDLKLLGVKKSRLFLVSTGQAPPTQQRETERERERERERESVSELPLRKNGPLVGANLETFPIPRSFSLLRRFWALQRPLLFLEACSRSNWLEEWDMRFMR